jgi:hypothetical protein
LGNRIAVNEPPAVEESIRSFIQSSLNSLPRWPYIIHYFSHEKNQSTSALNKEKIFLGNGNI